MALTTFYFSGDDSMSENPTHVSQESHIPVEEPGEEEGKQKKRASRAGMLEII
jgi:hypothetical protein